MKKGNKVLVVNGKKFKFNAAKLKTNLINGAWRVFSILTMCSYIVAAWAILADDTLSGAPSMKVRILISLPAIMMTAFLFIYHKTGDDIEKRNAKIMRKREMRKLQEEKEKKDFLDNYTDLNKAED